jgi:hypothetical protein
MIPIIWHYRSQRFVTWYKWCMWGPLQRFLICFKCLKHMDVMLVLGFKLLISFILLLWHHTKKCFISLCKCLSDLLHLHKGLIISSSWDKSSIFAAIGKAGIVIGSKSLWFCCVLYKNALVFWPHILLHLYWVVIQRSNVKPKGNRITCLYRIKL